MSITERNVRSGAIARRGLLLVSLSALISAAVILAVSHFQDGTGGVVTNKSLFLLLCSVLAVVLLAPTVYLILRQRFDLFHPLVYPVITYLFPSFVAGSLTLATSASPSWVLTLISDPDYYLNLALVYIIVGFVSLMTGFVLPGSAQLGLAVSRRIPDWNWSPVAIRLPGLVLFGVGLLSTILGYVVGVLGYQNREDPMVLGGTLSGLALLTTFGAFILWHGFFRRDRTRKDVWTPILILLIGQTLLNAFVSGSRYTLLQGFLVVVAAYRFAGGRFRARVLALVLGVGIAAAVLGLSLGTTFRELKGSENVMSLGETLNVAGMTRERLTDLGSAGTLNLAVDTLLVRVENLSSFAVIVSNYEKLKPFEAQYGIADNIWTYTWTALIPRFLWPDKPIVSDARAVGALYFGVPTNSFAMTVFGDLLRNFGPIGVPLGMLFLGFLLRVLYSAFVTQQVASVSAWCAATYFLLLTSINYESFYGTILPSWIRVIFVCIIAGVFANNVIRVRRSHLPTAVLSQNIPGPASPVRSLVRKVN